MAVPTYATDLTLIDDAQAVGNFIAVGGGAAALNDEGDYFINDAQCVSKNGFTATTKGQMADDVSAPTITSGDAVFMWARQANRNILDTLANGGGQFIMGTAAGDFDQFYVDGSNVEGSELLSWINYAVDPAATASATTGTPGSYDHFGFQWKILGSGSLKGAPNAVGVIRYGREITSIDGQAADYSTFLGAGAFDAGITRRWGIFTPVTGGYLFHGAFVMGTVATAVDFRDADRTINVIDDLFVPAGFNEFEIRHASSNVEWTNIIIKHIGTTSPAILTLSVGTFIGELCQFTGFDTTIFGTTGICTNSSWTACEAVTAGGADLTGSSILTPNVAANTSGLIWNLSQDTDGSLDDMTFTKTSGVAHHAIEFGTAIPTAASYTLRGIDFGTDFSGTEDASVGDETFHFLDTTGTIQINLIDCTGNFGYRTEGVVVTIVNAAPISITVTDRDGTPVENARVEVEALETVGTITTGDVLLTGLTSAAGVLADLGFNYESAFEPTGLDVNIKARQGSVSPLLVPGNAVSIVAASGLTLTMALLPDE